MSEERAQSQTFSELAGELVVSGLGFRFQAKGRSMLPTIQDGEFLHVWPANVTALKVGDIVLFKACDGFRAHRIIEKQREMFVTRGDSGLKADHAIRGEQIVGKIVAKECAQTGRAILLEGSVSRLKFFATE